MSDHLTGGCLCGLVRYEIKEAPEIIGHCHCVDCRKSSGTGHCTNIFVEEENLIISGEVRFYDRPADSGNMISRGFCPNCGSPLYSRNTGMPGKVFVRASSLDDPNAITPKIIVYSSRAAAWDHMDPSLPSFREMPEIANQK